MSDDKKIYRALQKHLDRQPVGFPAVRSGADLVLLEMLFTPQEARLACLLSYEPRPTAQIAAAAAGFEGAAIEPMLEALFQKGAIARKEKGGQAHWFLVPLVVGIFELQGANLKPRFLKRAGAYMRTLPYARSLISVKPPQMRTIPVNRSITPEHHVAVYDDMRALIGAAAGPFVVLDCICRMTAAMRRKPCLKTTRRETCLAMGDMAAMALRRAHGREISRTEALDLLTQNEEDGLVLQPSAVKEPQFICSCCGCCCGMLGLQHKLPRPVDFWVSGYFVRLAADRCKGCGKCAARCQVKALRLDASTRTVEVNLKRCIGCGLCVPACARQALRLAPRDPQPALPKDEEALQEAIKRNRKSALGQWLTLARGLLGV